MRSKPKTTPCKQLRYAVCGVLELTPTRKRHIVSDWIMALQSHFSETDLRFWLCVYDVIRRNVFKMFSRIH